MDDAKKRNEYISFKRVEMGMKKNKSIGGVL